jgi:hypothetical protein
MAVNNYIAKTGKSYTGGLEILYNYSPLVILVIISVLTTPQLQGYMVFAILTV